MDFKKICMVPILIISGAILQNFMWYLRLQNPMLLREFELYWAKDGAKLFLYFNMFNYLFLCIFLVILIIMIYNKKRVLKDVLNSTGEGK